MPVPDELTQFFWDGVNEGRLRFLRCDSCKKFVHLPKIVCPFCLSTQLSPDDVSGRGRLETYTIPMQPFHPWFRERIGYVLAVVELDEQVDLKMVTNIVDCEEDELRCDLRVRVDFREVYPGLTLPLFVLDR